MFTQSSLEGLDIGQHLHGPVPVTLSPQGARGQEGREDPWKQEAELVRG